jgi:AcrR family transcriptional regulator
MADVATGRAGPGPRRRADARRNAEALLDAARSVFEVSGVDAPAKEITDLAGVGVGTLYRHFPQRSDLIAAVLHREIDACADAAAPAGRGQEPAASLVGWIERYTRFLATKQGLARALQSGDPAFEGLHDHFGRRMGPALQMLLDAAQRSRGVRGDVGAAEVLRAVALLCLPAPGDGPGDVARRVAIFVDGLRRVG